MLFRTRITANIPQIKENINFTKIHGQFSAIHVDSLLERESPQIIRKLSKILISRKFTVNSRQFAFTKTEIRVASLRRQRRP